MKTKPAKKQPPKRALVLDLDRETQMLARAAYDILNARGAMPDGCTFERWVNDAVWERAEMVMLDIIGTLPMQFTGKFRPATVDGAPDRTRFCSMG